MIIEDFVMLGKTVPEANGDGRHFVCTAGYSFELRQPVRIYPMARIGCPPRWSSLRVPLERNGKDSRPESWKIRGDRSIGEHENINSVIDVVQKKIPDISQRDIVKALTVRSLKEANEKRLSLCVLLPADTPTLFFESGEEAEMAPTPDMFGYIKQKTVAARFKYHPRLRFKDEDGHAHNLMLRDWGCYELMRKKEEDGVVVAPYYMSDALNLTTTPPLFCGNLNRHRNAWLIIAVFSGRIHARPEVFDTQRSLFDS